MRQHKVTYAKVESLDDVKSLRNPIKNEKYSLSYSLFFKSKIKEIEHLLIDKNLILFFDYLSSPRVIHWGNLENTEDLDTQLSLDDFLKEILS